MFLQVAWPNINQIHPDFFTIKRYHAVGAEVCQGAGEVAGPCLSNRPTPAVQQAGIDELYSQQIIIPFFPSRCACAIIKREGGDILKRSEFAEIVNSVSQKELEKLNDAIQEAKNDNSYEKMIAEIAISIPAIAARTTAEILLAAGLLHLEDD